MFKANKITTHSMKVGNVVNDLLISIYMLFVFYVHNLCIGPSIGGSLGPYIQSQRRELYNKYVDVLLKVLKHIIIYTLVVLINMV